MKYFILGLAALIALNCQGAEARADESRVVKAAQDIRALESALQFYERDHGTYPTEAEGLAVLVTATPKGNEANTTIGYIKKLPKDPWGYDYQYRNPGRMGGKIDLWTQGADGAPGGEGLYADYGNWPGSFEKYFAETSSRANIKMTILWLGTWMIWACLVGLPIYIRCEQKIRRGEALGPKAHLYIVAYLLVASPPALALAVFAMSFSVVIE